MQVCVMLTLIFRHSSALPRAVYGHWLMPVYKFTSVSNIQWRLRVVRMSEAFICIAFRLTMHFNTVTQYSMNVKGHATGA